MSAVALEHQLTPGDLDAAARTVWGEARGHAYDTLLHVALVLCNRVRSRHRCEKSLLEVVTEPWQFACWHRCNPSYRLLLRVDLSDPQFRLAMMAVLQAIDTPPAVNPTRGALHYLTPAAHAASPWARHHSPLFADGVHVFFNTDD